MLAIQPNLANWADRLQANIDILNADSQRRQIVTLGETVAAFAAAYVKGSDGKAYNAQGVSGMLPVVGLANEAGNLNDQIRLVTFGVVTNPSWTWTPQKLLIASAATAGLLAEATSPLTMGSQNLFRLWPFSLTATSIFVCPSLASRMDFKAAPYTTAGKPATKRGFSRAADIHHRLRIDRAIIGLLGSRFCLAFCQ